MKKKKKRLKVPDFSISAMFDMEDENMTWWATQQQSMHLLRKLGLLFKESHAHSKDNSMAPFCCLLTTGCFAVSMCILFFKADKVLGFNTHRNK